MLVGFPLALLAVAQTAAAAPAPTAAAPATPTSVPAPKRPDDCGPLPNTDSRTIVVCAPKPQGYRLDPDVMEARREHRNHTHPPPPAYRTMQANNCATVGPMGCRGNVGIDLVSAAGVLAEMAARASRGENVGQMFVTDPQPNEYQLYVEAKKRREAKEAQEAAAKAKAAALAPRSGSGQPAQPGGAAAPAPQNPGAL